jgi:tetratricopeptide (TPR) repeat protein
MSAKEAIQKGKYEQDDRKFTDNIKDAAKQHDLLQKDSMTQRRDYLEQQVKKTRHEYEANPTVQGKIHALVDALLKFETTEAEAEAIAVLERAFKDTRAYQHKLRIGDVRIRQMSREYSRLKDAGDTAGATEQAHRQLDFEIAEFVERVENYPTDLTMRYELGRRYLIGGRFDEAIPLLQEAQRDARRHVSALNYLGQAFVGRNMLPEACDTYQRALRAELTEDAVKKIRYNLGDVLERIGDFEKAQEEFSLVAQIDYNYKDVRTRLDRIRAEIEKRRKP